jgi:hypothetical protein
MHGGRRMALCAHARRVAPHLRPGSSFSPCWIPATGSVSAGFRSRGGIGRQIDLMAIREFDILQVNVAPAAFDHTGYRPETVSED